MVEGENEKSILCQSQFFLPYTLQRNPIFPQVIAFLRFEGSEGVFRFSHSEFPAQAWVFFFPFLISSFLYTKEMF